MPTDITLHTFFCVFVLNNNSFTGNIVNLNKTAKFCTRWAFPNFLTASSSSNHKSIQAYFFATNSTICFKTKKSHTSFSLSKFLLNQKHSDIKYCLYILLTTFDIPIIPPIRLICQPYNYNIVDYFVRIYAYKTNEGEKIWMFGKGSFN